MHSLRTEPLAAETDTSNADLPVFTTDQIARQLTHGGWAASGASAHRFNVAPGGSLTVNLTALTAEGQFLARQALLAWTDASGILFTEVASGGQITFDDDKPDAYATYFASGDITSRAHVNVSPQWIANYGTGLNTYSFQTYVHEIGHALGLAHAGNYNGSASYSFDAYYANDSWATTIMSYFDQSENTYFARQGFSKQFVLTPMFADGVAMTSLYGVNTSTRTGDTTYGFNNTSGRAWYDAAQHPDVGYTIYDNGGTDTLDYSGFSAAQRINLNPEAFSNVGGGVGNVVIARDAVIENAIGGSGADTLVGNAADNGFTGRAGNDRIEGGGGTDTAAYAGPLAQYTIAGSGVNFTISGPDGTDTLIDVERAQFGDQLVTLSSVTPTPAPPPPSTPPPPPPPAEIAGSAATTTSLEIGGSTSSVIEVAGDHDWFRASLTAGQTYVFRTTAPPSGAAVDTTITVRNSAGTGLAFNDDFTGVFSQVTYTATATGTYFIDVGAFSNQTGGYTISAANVTPPPPEVDVPGTTASTVSLGIDSSVASRLDNASDHDFFRVQLTAGQTYVFETSEGTGGGHPDTTLTLRNSAGTQLAFNDDTTGLFSRIQFTAPTTGTYFLDVAGFDGGTGTYTLRATSGTVPAVDVAASTSTTASIGINAMATSTVDAAGDRDWFRVDLVAGRSYTFRTGAVAQVAIDTTLAVRDSAGTQLAFNDDEPDSQFSLIRFTPASTGTYYLDVGAFGNVTGGYSLTAASAVSGTAGNDTLLGTSVDDTLSGGAGNDVLGGGPASDLLDGGIGNDQLFGDGGNDLLFGQPGDDLLVGGPGDDIIGGSDGNDTLGGDDGNDFLDANAGLDSLYGHGGADTAIGGSGTDVLAGGGGSDEMAGGDDNDQLFGDDGDDRMYGDFGDDVVVGGSGFDVLSGGPGADLLGAGDEDDLLVGDDGGDTLLGEAGLDTLIGGGGTDVLAGGTGNDTLAGGDSFDFLYGEAGDDVLFGEAGDDWLTGGAGTDLMVGAAGHDNFVFAAGHGADGVLDFSAGAGSEDVLWIDSGFTSFPELMASTTQLGADTVIVTSSSGTDGIVLLGVNRNSLHPDDFVLL